MTSADEHGSKASSWPLEKLLSGIDALVASGNMDEHDAHALADRCAFKAGAAAAKGQEGEAIDWAGVAIKVYEYLANGNAAKKERFLESAMMLRATLIGKLGEKIDDPIRDGKRLKDWFLGRITRDLESVNSLLQKRQELPVETLKELRALKNRLKLLRPAMTSGSLSGDSELSAWMGLERNLP